MMAALDLAAQLLRHRLLAIADAEHRHVRPGDRCRRERRALLDDRPRAAGENDALRPHLGKSLLGLLERHDLAIDALLAHPARDELGHLGAEIDDENLVVHGGWRLVRRRKFGVKSRASAADRAGNSVTSPLEGEVGSRAVRANREGGPAIRPRIPPALPLPLKGGGVGPGMW